ncbi:MAG: DNA-binding GntR family transcriptional regulator [Granulosicoccus sp.]|jgi:DNA-binding GntR family transcriptional regulator
MINESEKPISLSGKKSDLAYAALKRAIMLRQYVPGQQIREQAVASEYQCSQSTVREALINLSKDGLVKRTGYHGTHVTDTTLEEATALVRVRLTIERCVAAQLHARRSNLDPALVMGILCAMDTAHASGDLFRCSELDRDFHAQLAIMAGMEQLAPVLQRCALHIHRFTLGSAEVPRHFFQETGVGEEHRVLYQSLFQATVQQSESAITQHLAQVLQRWAPSLHAAVGADQF